MDADLLEAVRKRQVADALPDEETDPDWLYAGNDTSSDQEPVAAASREIQFNPNAQSLADYSRPPQPLESEYAGVAEDQAPKVVQPGAVPSPLPAVLQPEYAGISPDQEGRAAPDIVPQVERGQLVSTPPVPPVSVASAEVTPGVAPPVTEPAPDTLTQVERATPVSLPPPQPVAQASRELALRAQLMKLPPVQPVAQAARELGIAPRAQPVVQPVPDTLAQVERGQLVDSDPDKAQLELASLYGANVPSGTIAQPPAAQPQARERLGPNDQSLDDYAKPVAALVTPTVPVPVTGDLAQGPPGTHPAGTKAEPYWPKAVEQIGQLPPGSVYIDPRDGSVKTTPGKAPAAGQPKGVPTTLPDVGPGPVTQAKLPDTAQGPVTQARLPDVSTYKNPDGSNLPSRVQAVGNNDPAAFITHHTSGRGTVDGVISTLKQRGLGVQYVMDREGNIFQTGGPGAQNILTGWGPKGTGLSNQNIVGMEIIAKDDKDVTPAQAQSFARFIAARYPNTPIFGHGEVNPGHKEADEGQTAKAAALAYRAQGGQPQGDQVARAEPATKGKDGLYANEKPEDFLTGRATVFATDDDIASGRDNGVGSPKLGRVNTNQAAAVAVPQEALIQAFGNNPAAWRRARVDVVDTSTGKRLRLPIADLGPRGDLSAVIDQTPFVANYFGGDKTLSVKLVPNAGPDITKNPQLWADEQAAIRQGIDSSSLQAGVQKIQGNLNYTLVSPDAAAHQKLMAADAANQAKMRSTLTQLPEAESGNMIGFYNRLSSSVPGIPDSMRATVQAELKPQIIAAMRAKFPEIKTDQEAWAKATSNVNVLDIGREWWDKTIGNLQGLTNVMQKGRTGADQFSVDQYLQKVLPGATDQQRQDYLHRYYMMTPEQQAQEIQSHLPGQFGLGGAYPSEQSQTVIQALKHLADPGFMKRQADELAQSTADMKRNVSDDPRLTGTGMGKALDAIGQVPAVLATFSNPIMWPVGLAQANEQIKAGLKSDHPDWTEKQLQDNSAYATIVSFFGQAVAAEVMGGGGGALMNALRGRGAKAIAQVAFGSGSAAAISGGSQVATNVLTGAPVMRGVGDAAVTGAIQGAVTGGIHGAGELAKPGEKAVLTPEVPPPVPPTTQPVTRAGVLGPDVPDISVPWYKPPPIVTRGVERGAAFSPSELVAAVQRARESGSPEQIRTAIENLRAGTNFNERTVHLAVQPEISPAAPVTQEDVARRTYEIGQERTQSGQPGNALNDWARAQLELSHATEPSPVTHGESEPWVSAIANRFTAERAARGEVGEVIPGEGYSKEELLAKGLQMGPEQINQHVSDLMNNRGGDPKLQAAAVRAEEARLSQRSNAASRASEASPANRQLQIDANVAFQDLTDFHNGPVATLKNNWHAQGMTLQGEIPIDLSTFNGLRERFLRENGEAPSKNMEPLLQKTAKAVAESTAADRAAMAKLGQEIERQSARRRLPTDEEVRNRIMETVKDYPCR